MDDLDTGAPKFLPQLLSLRQDVQEYAPAEERYEFIHIRRSADAATLA